MDCNRIQPVVPAQKQNNYSDVSFRCQCPSVGNSVQVRRESMRKITEDKGKPQKETHDALAGSKSP